MFATIVETATRSDSLGRQLSRYVRLIGHYHTGDDTQILQNPPQNNTVTWRSEVQRISKAEEGQRKRSGVSDWLT